jgi:hypothetical protein
LQPPLSEGREQSLSWRARLAGWHLWRPARRGRRPVQEIRASLQVLRAIDLTACVAQVELFQRDVARRRGGPGPPVEDQPRDEYGTDDEGDYDEECEEAVKPPEIVPMSLDGALTGTGKEAWIHA